MAKQQDHYSDNDFHWIPASNGTEQPFVLKGKKYQYMWNYRTNVHMHYCITDDVFLEQDEFFRLTQG